MQDKQLIASLRAIKTSLDREGYVLDEKTLKQLQIKAFVAVNCLMDISELIDNLYHKMLLPIEYRSLVEITDYDQAVLDMDRRGIDLTEEFGNWHVSEFDTQEQQWTKIIPFCGSRYQAIEEYYNQYLMRDLPMTYAWDHWIVTDKLYSYLRERDQIVAEFYGLKIWARTNQVTDAKLYQVHELDVIEEIFDFDLKYSSDFQKKN